jgi:protein O-mannosyl-transferase
MRPAIDRFASRKSHGRLVTVDSAVELPPKFRPSAALLAAAAVLLYLRTCSFDLTYLDDKSLIVAQAAWLTRLGNWLQVFERSYFGSPHDTYYRPIVNLSLLLDATSGGMRPFGFHLTNTLLHAVNCVLLLRLLTRLGFGLSLALAGAVVFAVHPVQVASIAWIPGRNDLLLVSFALLSALSLPRARQRFEAWATLTHLACFTLALFTKETAVVLPILFILVLALRDNLRSVLRQPWILFGWGVAVAGYLLARSAVVILPDGYAAERWGVMSAHWPLLLVDTGKLVFPSGLQVLGDPNDTPLGPGAMASAIAVVAVSLVRGKHRRMLALAGAFVLLPWLASLPGTRYVLLDNRLYLPMVGLAILVAELMRGLQGRTRSVVGGAWLALVTVCTIFVVIGWHHAEKYRDREGFSAAALQAAPRSSIAIHLRFRQFYHREIEDGQGTNALR